MVLNPDDESGVGANLSCNYALFPCDPESESQSFAILVALSILVVLIAAVFLQSRRSPKPIEIDDLYGLLD